MEWILSTPNSNKGGLIIMSRRELKKFLHIKGNVNV
jgi:hypothetical protein